jgi:urease subunit gamma/beta
MRLTAWEEERLLIFSAAELARRHRHAGLPLNQPETVALICDAMLEAARAGGSLADVEAAGRAAVRPDEVMDGVAGLVDEVRLEVLVGDGTRLVVLLDPLGPPPSGALVPGVIEAGPGTPPRVRPDAVELEVTNTSTRVVRVSSHYPFERVNQRLSFDRAAAAGRRLDLPAGATERWAPGETRTVRLVPYRSASGSAAS